jgi:adenosine deaminase
VNLTDEALARLPKAELHVHLEGSMPPETLLELGVRHGIDEVPKTLEEVRRFFDFRDFAHFIEVYTMSAEYRIARDLIGGEALLRAARAGFENSLLPEDRKLAYLKEFDETVATLDLGGPITG